MARWFEFMGNHPFLFGILFVLIVLFFMIETRRGGKKIAPSELSLMVNNQNARVIDIRPANKFATGYIQGSENISFTDLPNKINELKAESRPLIIICEIGMQAGMAVSMIGRENVYRLEGGITNWQASGLPLVGTKTSA